MNDCRACQMSTVTHVSKYGYVNKKLTSTLLTLSKHLMSSESSQVNNDTTCHKVSTFMMAKHGKVTVVYSLHGNCSSIRLGSLSKITPVVVGP